ncbi:hypothetical protein [Seohaeicola zhoushanensis]|uniref:Secreted protein n=1 Tax=Seohaeicola zhoushanensis TaxID=1569283 RepID=A0A8J3M7K4_9RHOB|nr:hypothetical protein [Seohaeicola zhoushanensis]GHF35764.1 hypothetical protein GCM10017056_04350 [Seohaeicola zhoushanensis]
MKTRLVTAALLCLLAAPAIGQSCQVLGTQVICSEAMADRIAANPALYGQLAWDPQPVVVPASAEAVSATLADQEPACHPSTARPVCN